MLAQPVLLSDLIGRTFCCSGRADDVVIASGRYLRRATEHFRWAATL